jgi:hypothetical protein
VDAGGHEAGAAVRFRLPNVTPVDLAYSLTDAIPVGLDYVPASATASAGTIDVTGNVLTWSGTMPVAGGPVAITYQAEAQVSAGGRTLTNRVASLTDNPGDATAVTEVALYVIDTGFFSDDFESGDTSAWD